MNAQAEPTAAQPSAAGRQYVGSTTCKTCHPQIYARWEKTRMANVVRDPKQHPEAILPDLSKPDPLVTFNKDDIAFVYGSKWKQRYFKKVGDDYFVFPAQWDVTHQVWRPYFVKNGTDWWGSLYPPDNMKRPASQISTTMAECLSLTSTWAIYGSSLKVIRIRYKACRQMVANSCWYSMMANSPRMIRPCSRGGCVTRHPRC